MSEKTIIVRVTVYKQYAVIRIPLRLLQNVPRAAKVEITDNEARITFLR